MFCDLLVVFVCGGGFYCGCLRVLFGLLIVFWSCVLIVLFMLFDICLCLWFGVVIDLLRGFGGLIGSFGLCLCLLCGWFRLLVCGG